MKANETRVQDFLSANKTRFVIPIYQRNYDWTTSQCKLLLDDILYMGVGDETAHFIETNFSSVAKFDIIKYALEVFDSEDELTIKYAA